jgi:hypothetical protein
MAWAKAGSTTLGSSGSDVTVSSLPDNKFYMVLSNLFDTGGAIDGGWRFNGDTGSNYAARRSYNGAADSTLTSGSWAQEGVGLASENFWVSYIVNISSEEKLAISNTVYEKAAGAGTAPDRNEHYAKWAYTSGVITDITQHEGSAGSYDTDSNVSVIGSD